MLFISWSRQISMNLVLWKFALVCSFPFVQFEPILSIECHANRLQSTRLFFACCSTFGFQFYDFFTVLNFCGSIIVWQWCSHGAHKQAYLHSAWSLLKITIHAAAKQNESVPKNDSALPFHFQKKIICCTCYLSVCKTAKIMRQCVSLYDHNSTLAFECCVFDDNQEKLYELKKKL